jgi:Flp pilus assembly protein TadD
LRRCAASLALCPKQVAARLVAHAAHRELHHAEEALQALVEAEQMLGHSFAEGSAAEVEMDRARLWSMMGQSQLQLGRPAQARQSFRRALEAREGRCARTLIGLAQCALAENAPDEALRLAEEARALAPEDEGASDLACFILAKMGRCEEAAERVGGEVLRRRPMEERVALLKGAFGKTTSHSEGWNDLGILLFRSGRMEEAIECLSKACRADPQNFRAIENLIELFSRAGKRGPAAALALQWTRSHPSSSRAWAAWGKLNLLAGDLTGARAALARAHRSDPADAAIREALESLEDVAQ